MSESFKKKSSNIVLTLFIGLITISFMMTGYSSFNNSTPDTVIQIGDEAVKIKEFSNAYNQQLQFYKRFSGGKDLTSAEIKRYNIVDNTIQNLIQRQLQTNFGGKIAGAPGEQQVKTEIKKMSYFLTDGKFDINRYKILLANNALTPTDFEKSVENNIQSTIGQATLKTYPISKSFAKDILSFKDDKLDLRMIKINKQSLTKNIEVKAAEITNFLSNEVNKNRVQSVFNKRKTSLGTKEEVKARHILLKTDGKNDAKIKTKIEELAKIVTAKNFIAMAKKHTQEPGGDKSGGSLGFFTRGKMVPAFEKKAFAMKVGEISAPIKTQFGYHIILVEAKKAAIVATFDKFKNQLSTDFIQKDKKVELKALVEKLKKNLITALNKGTTKEIEKLKAKYNFQYEAKSSINRFDGSKGQIHLSDKELKTVFDNKDTNQLIPFDNDINLTLITVLHTASVKAKKDAKAPTQAEKVKTELASLESDYGRQFSQTFLKDEQDKTNIKVFKNILRL